MSVSGFLALHGLFFHEFVHLKILAVFESARHEMNWELKILDASVSSQSATHRLRQGLERSLVQKEVIPNV